MEHHGSEIFKKLQLLKLRFCKQAFITDSLWWFCNFDLMKLLNLCIVPNGKLKNHFPRKRLNVERNG